MRLINLFGGPCSGKSTTASTLFSYFKNRGVRCELVGEVAKTLIYEGREHLLGAGGNQLLILALQYDRLLGMAHAGCDLAICDCPLVVNLAYSKKFSYYPEMVSIVKKLNAEFTSINVLIERTEHYDPQARLQKTIEEARVIDDSLCELFVEAGVDKLVHARGDEAGQLELARTLYLGMPSKPISQAWGFSGYLEVFPNQNSKSEGKIQ